VHPSAEHFFLDLPSRPIIFVALSTSFLFTAFLCASSAGALLSSLLLEADLFLVEVRRPAEADDTCICSFVAAAAAAAAALAFAVLLDL
jgi:hypothetical protein